MLQSSSKDVSPSTEDLLASLNKALPCSDEAEKGVLSCWLQHPARCEDGPDPATFYYDANRIIASAIMTLHATKKVDPVTLTHALRDAGLLDKVGGPATISELYAFVPIPAHFPYYSDIMREKFQLRQMIGALAGGIAHLQAFTGQDGQTIADALEHARSLVCEAVNDDGSPDIPCRPFKELMAQVVDQAEAFQQKGGGIPGLSTGLLGVDQIMGGMEHGCLTIIAAESSDGKSSLGRQMLEEVCAEGHYAVDYTYEMQPVTEARRVMCSRSGVDSTKVKRGDMSRGEQQSFAAHMSKMLGWNFSIVDVAGRTIEQICRDIARRCRKLPPGKKLVTMIDYIQLCKTAAKTNNREREVAHITATAKQCAKMTGAHIIMPSQVNKEGDVRESMAVEQDADTLVKIEKPQPEKAQPQGRKQSHYVQQIEAGHGQGSDSEITKDDGQRDLFFKKVRDGERFKRVRVRLVPGVFHFKEVATP